MSTAEILLVPNAPPPGGAVPVLDHLINDSFVTPELPKIATPRDAQPGPGILDVYQTNGDCHIEANQRCWIIDTGGAGWGELGLIDSLPMPRTAGALLFCDVNVTTNPGVGPAIGWTTVTTPNPLNAGSDVIYFSAAGDILRLYASNSAVVGSFTPGEIYECCVIMREVGTFLAIRGGTEYADGWSLLYVHGIGAHANTYAFVGARNNLPWIDNLRIPGTYVPAPRASDSFDRADSANVGDTDGQGAPESGGAGLTWVEILGDWEILNNRLNLNVLGGGLASTLIGIDPGISDVVIQTVAQLPGLTVGAGIVFRLSDVDNFWLLHALSGTDTLTLYQFQSGWTTHDSTSVPIPASTDFDLQIAAHGQEIRGYFNDATTVSYLSGSFNQTATIHGCRGTIVNAQFDNFVVWPRILPIPAFPKYPDPAFLWQFNESFMTPMVGPLPNPNYASPGPGIEETYQIDGFMYVNQNQELQIEAQSAPAWNRQGISMGGYPRVPGQMMAYELRVDSGSFGPVVGWAILPSATYTGMESLGIYVTGPNNIWGIAAAGVQPQLGQFTAGLTYEMASIMRAAGSFICIKGGTEYPDWTLLYVYGDGVTPTMYPIYANFNANAVMDDWVAPELLYTPTPLLSDSFDGTDDDPIAGRTTDGGGAEESGGSGLVWSVSGDWVVKTNEATTQGAQPGGLQWTIQADVGQNNVMVQCTTNSRTISSWGGPTVRIAGSPGAWSNAWQLFLEPNSDQISLYHWDGANWNVYATSALPISPSVDYEAILVADGTDLRGFVDHNAVSYFSATMGQFNTVCGHRHAIDGSTINNYVVWPRRLADFPVIPKTPDPDVLYSLHDSFVVDQSPPMTTPRRCEYGPGMLTFFELRGYFQIVSGKLEFNAPGGAVWGEQSFVGDPFLRTAGLMFLIELDTQSTGSSARCVFGATKTVGGSYADLDYMGFYPVHDIGTGLNLSLISDSGAWAMGIINDIVIEPYELAQIQRTNGSFYFYREATPTQWTLLFVDKNANSSTIYPMFGNYTQFGTVDNFRVPSNIMWTPTPLASDAFARADSNNLGWTDGLGAEEGQQINRQWVKETGDWRISNQKLRAEGVLPPNGAFYATIDPGEKDILIQTILHYQAAHPAIAIRTQDEQNGYLAQAHSTRGLVLAAVIGNVFTIHAEVGKVWASGVDFDIDATVDGTIFRAWAETVSTSMTMSNFLNATKCGCKTNNELPTFDNFVVWERRPSDFPANV